MVHWIGYLREAKGGLQRSFGIASAQSERCSTRNSMDIEMYMDIGSADYWCMRCCWDTTIICIYIAFTYSMSYGGIRKWLRLILDLFSLSSCPFFESLLFQLDTVALCTVLTYE
jgi:hypothetical protein